MPNDEQVHRLEQSGDSWEFWRMDNPEITPDLRDAMLGHKDLSYRNLSYANLSGADLEGTSLYGTNLSYADLTHTILFDADLSSTNLENADLTNAQVGGTRFGNTDLSQVKGLESAYHSRPSSIGIDTIYESKGKISEVFLRRAGVPDSFITFMESLSQKSFEFYSCFISYTDSDDAFAQTLYYDLQDANVRCWRWKEDAKWGKTLMRSINDAIRLYDKLIVVCSESSLSSPAVIREIERALQKEDELARQGKEDDVLFPIRLDDYIFMNWNHHRKADVIAKNIGDFRDWKNPISYSEKLERLVRDLKAEQE